MSSPRLAASLRGSGSWSSCWGRFASLLRLEEVGREVRVELAPHRCFASRKWVTELVLSSPRLAASLRLADLQPYVVLNSLSCPLSLSTASPALCRFRQTLLPFVVFDSFSCPLLFPTASPTLCRFRPPLLSFVVLDNLSWPLSFSPASPALCCFRQPLLPFVVFDSLSCPLLFSICAPIRSVCRFLP